MDSKLKSRLQEECPPVIACTDVSPKKRKYEYMPYSQSILYKSSRNKNTKATQKDVSREANRHPPAWTKSLPLRRHRNKVEITVGTTIKSPVDEYLSQRGGSEPKIRPVEFTARESD